MALKDIFSPLGGLEKLKITAFTDINYNQAVKTYVVMYNPTAYSTEVKNTWIPEEGATPDGSQSDQHPGRPHVGHYQPPVRV